MSIINYIWVCQWVCQWVQFVDNRKQEVVLAAKSEFMDKHGLNMAYVFQVDE